MRLWNLNKFLSLVNDATQMKMKPTEEEKKEVKTISMFELLLTFSVSMSLSLFLYSSFDVFFLLLLHIPCLISSSKLKIHVRLHILIYGKLIAIAMSLTE